MSKLSERCKQYLEADGQTVYGFSKSTGLDRTSVHRLVNGKRLPSREFLLNFCKGLCINAQDVKEILELYEEEKAGPAVYQNRKYILRFLSAVHSMKNQIPDDTIFSFPNECFSFTNTLSATRVQIFQLLESAFHGPSEVPCILTNLPTDSAIPITGCLCRLYSKYHRHVLLKHLITFAPNPAAAQDVNCNLESIARILPLALSDFNTYLPYCTYGHIDSNSFSWVPWPYYIMTGDAVLEISYDMKRSILHREPAQVRQYHRELERIFSEARPLMQIPRTLADSAALYTKASLPSHPILATLECLPCFTWSVPQSLIMDTAKKLLDASAWKEHLGTLLHLPAAASNMPVYFSMNGLIAFMKTGQITGQMAAYLPPLKPEERRQTLKNFLAENGKSLFSAQLLKLNLAFPSNLYIELLPEQQLLFCMFHTEKPPRFVLLREASIYEAFVDFFHYLNDSLNSYSVRETNEIVESLMNEYLSS